MVAGSKQDRQHRRAVGDFHSTMDISDGEDLSTSHEISSEDEGDGERHLRDLTKNTNRPLDIGPVDPEIKALISTATQMAGSADSGSLALAALRASNPNDALMLIAACSTKASIDVQRSNDTAVSAMVKAQLAEEANTNSDYTYEARWRQQREENEKLKERLDRVETVLKQLVGMVVQTRGADDDQIADMMKTMGL